MDELSSDFGSSGPPLMGDPRKVDVACYRKGASWRYIQNVYHATPGQMMVPPGTLPSINMRS